MDGQRYEIAVTNPTDGPSSNAAEQRFVAMPATAAVAGQPQAAPSQLLIKGNEDGSVALLNPDGSVARTIAKDGMKTEADRNPLFVTIMLLALSMVSIGNGFFKPNISTSVGSLYDATDRRSDAGFTIFDMGSNRGAITTQDACPSIAERDGGGRGRARFLKALRARG